MMEGNADGDAQTRPLLQHRRFASFYSGQHEKKTADAPKAPAADAPAPKFELRFDMFPLHLREGPWSWVASVSLAIVALGLALTAGAAFDTFVADDGVPQPPPSLATLWADPRAPGAAAFYIHAGCALWGIGLLVGMGLTIGLWYERAAFCISCRRAAACAHRRRSAPLLARLTCGSPAPPPIAQKCIYYYYAPRATFALGRSSPTRCFRGAS
jgi:hypothetical protein